jgi:hypothetical protein
MAGITRIKIESSWHDWRTVLSDLHSSVADKIYRTTFDNISMPISEGREDVICTKDEAISRYDWKEGIDVILNFQSGGKATLQEKFLTFKNSTATFEIAKTSGAPGAWYYCTAQYHFWGYTRNYWDWQNRVVMDIPVIGFQDWMLCDLPAIHRADATGRISWLQDQNGRDGRRATFKYVHFDNMPADCVIKRCDNPQRDYLVVHGQRVYL